MSKKHAPTPLLELAGGRDQEDRTDLYLAFKRSSGHRKVTQTNLHVRELLMWIMAVDVTRQGVAKSYCEIAERLELKNAEAARYVIKRASVDFRLLIVTEARYERGGQNANRYSINWSLVRAIRDGIEDGNPWRSPDRPGVTESHPPVTESHPPVTESHPYKEYSRTVSRITNINQENYSPPGAIGNHHQPQEEESFLLKENFPESRGSGEGGESRGSSVQDFPESRGSGEGGESRGSFVQLDRLVERANRAGVWSAYEVLASLATLVGLDHIEQLLDYFDARDDLGPGALWVRLKRTRPGLSVQAAWPMANRKNLKPAEFKYQGIFDV